MTAQLSKDLPSDFRIFAKGWNDTAKGKFLFDEEAAKSVMDEYEKHGVDRMIDLEHLSIDTESAAYNPDAKGWFNLEIRDGALWAVNVRWTPDGAARLKNATQRYISPFFSFDEKSLRVQSLYNVAICAIPATYNIPALVAASARTGKKLCALSIGVKMNEDLKKVCSALGLGDDSTLEDVLAALKALKGADDEGGDSDETMKRLKKALGLDDDASEEDAFAALEARGGYEHISDDEEKKAEEQLEARGGYEHISDDEEKSIKKPKTEEQKEKAALAAMPPKMRARFMALTHNNDELRRRVERIERGQHKSEVEQLIAANTDKLSLKLEVWARKQEPAVLREYLKHAIATPRSSKERARADVTTSVALTAEELKICALSGQKPSELLAHKQSEAAKKADKLKADSIN